jgi:hypothetical protein
MRRVPGHPAANPRGPRTRPGHRCLAKTVCVALAIHKAQGLTVDEGVVVADASMAAESLYVGMTRGRRANRVMVVCEILGQVLTRPNAESSAHRVLRAGLQRTAGPGLDRDAFAGYEPRGPAEGHRPAPKVRRPGRELSL